MERSLGYLGLFVGVDRFASPEISWLTSAVRDATALYALFGDTFGAGQSSLLTDQAATRGAIEKEFERLAGCEPDDVVVITFSGHGTPSHELVTFDAELSDLRRSCISLDTLTEWFSRIPARRLICVLDCCFSGGAGAKVLQPAALARSVASVDDALDRLSGQGRLIITASGPTQEALENPQLGHGLLSFHLLEALQGAPEVERDGRIPVYPLLQHVTTRVADASSAFGSAQQPTLRGQIDGEFAWPVLKPGLLFSEYFPERATEPATQEVSSLASFGFPEGLLHAWRSTIGRLNELQVQAINDYGALDGKHLVVVAPTSSGKTMIGELVAAKAALERRRAIFLLPLRALVADKYREFVERYGEYGLITIRATGEIADDIPALMRGRYDMCLMTYEKFTSLAIGSPHVLKQVGVVVVDELQMIADSGRGANLEFLLTLLRVRRRQGIDPQVIALSGVIGSSNGLENWLDARLLRSDRRPVPLNEGILGPDGSYRYLAADGGEQRVSGLVQPEFASSANRSLLAPLIRRIVSEDKQVLVFRETRGEARNVARYLAQELQLPPATEALTALPTGDPSVAGQQLRSALEGGVAFHISDLNRIERQVVEEHFRRPDSAVRVIVATTTLAMGVNTPADAVVIVGLDHPGPEGGPYAVAEYKNMVGRAGRLGYADEGHSYLLATRIHEEERLWRSYVLCSPEDIESQFLSTHDDPRSLIVRVLAAAPSSSGAGLSASEILAFVSESFGAFREVRQGRDPISTGAVEQALRVLESRDLVEIDSEGSCTLTSLGRLAGESGVHVDSILRAVDALQVCLPSEITDPTLLAMTQATVELDDIHFPLNRTSTKKEPAAWIGELARQGVAPSVLSALQIHVRDSHTPTLRAKKAVSCLFWVGGAPLIKIEQIMTQFGGRPARDAAGEIRRVTMRTADILPVIAGVAELLHPGLDLSLRIASLMTRLELGVPASVVELAAAGKERLSRAVLLTLVEAEIETVEQVLAAPDETLARVLREEPELLEDLRAAAQQALVTRNRHDLTTTAPDFQR